MPLTSSNNTAISFDLIKNYDISHKNRGRERSWWVCVVGWRPWKKVYLHRPNQEDCVCVSVCVCESLSHVWLFLTPWTIARQALLSMEFSRQEYWSGLPCPSPGDLPNLTHGSIPGLPHCRQILYHLSHWGILKHLKQTSSHGGISVLSRNGLVSTRRTF